MKKILVIILVVATVGILGYVVYSSKKKESARKINIPVVETIVTSPSTSQVGLKKYMDEVGFSFFYMKEVEVKPLVVSDNTVYSMLELTSKNNPGKVTIIAKTSFLKTVDGSFKNDVKDIKKLKLADLEARQIEQEGKIVTVALDQGVLFEITVDYKESKNFWSEVNNKIIASFVFELPEAPSTTINSNDGGSIENSGASGDEDVIYEGEEIIE